MSDEQINDFAKKVEMWTSDFNVLCEASKVIVHDMHAMRCHVPSFLRLYRNLLTSTNKVWRSIMTRNQGIFSGQLTIKVK